MPDKPTTAADAVAPTPAAQWGQDALYRLPSGHVARLRRPSLMAMAVNGLIGNPYLKRLLSGSDTALTDADRWERYDQNARGFVACAELCLIEPKLAVDRPPQAGEIVPAQLSDADLLWLYFTFAEGDEPQVAPFRVEGQPPAPARAR